MVLVNGFSLRVLLLHALVLSPPLNFTLEVDEATRLMADQISGVRIMQHVRDLSAFGTRYALSDKCNESAMHLYRYFSSLEGFTPSLHYFKLTDHLTGLNVLARKDGADEGGEYVLLFAHYDSISNDPFVSAPGANDNAGGVAVMMEVARVMGRYEWNRTLIFIAFSGEELGFQGSMRWVTDDQELLVDVAGAVCLDGVGRGERISVMFADEESKTLADLMVNVSITLGFTSFHATSNFLGVSGSDSSAFLGRGLRVVRLWDEDTEFIHTSQDKPDTLKPRRLIEAAKVVLTSLSILSTEPLDELFQGSLPSEGNWTGWGIDERAVLLGVAGIVLILTLVTWRFTRPKAAG